MTERSEGMDVPLERLVGPVRWRECTHKFGPFFGPLLRCEHCGATTTICVAAGESKPIDAPIGCD